MVQKILGKSDIFKGGMHIEEPLNEVPRLQQQHEDENKTKTNVTPEAGDMTSANQTPGGYKFAPLLAINNQLQVLYGVCKAAEMCVCVYLLNCT